VLEEAIEYSPRDGELLAALAFARATSPQAELRQGERALELAKRAAAAQHTPSVETLDARAAALAELGRFEAATMAVQEALASARVGRRIDLVPSLEARLAGYRANRPYRDPLPSSPPLP
jgi:Flp pilus assembly protein TadD